MSKLRLFGTDGIRGIVNTPPIDPINCVKIAQAIAHYYTRRYPDKTVQCIIGKDTRVSGYMLECALVSGLVSKGVDVILIGPMPTPSVSNLVTTLRLDFGIMISASHNLFQDNGIKIFNHIGHKIDEGIESEIEQLYACELPYSAGEIGKARRLDDVTGRYIEFVKNTLPRSTQLQKKKIVIDCANGAGYKVAPLILWELGFDVISINNQPNGTNINAHCGSTATAHLIEEVKKHKADLGIALDGDADRVVLIDETGMEIAGEHILGVLAESFQAQRVVTTTMANPGLEQFLNNIGAQVIYTDVGDKKVLDAILSHRCHIGGEPSGHFIFPDLSSTSDGMIAALQILYILDTHQWQASMIRKRFPLIPQITKNIPIAPALYPYINIEECYQRIEGTSTFSSKIIMRKSGTENTIRLCLWHHNTERLKHDLGLIENQIGEMLCQKQASV